MYFERFKNTSSAGTGRLKLAFVFYAQFFQILLEVLELATGIEPATY